jgi:hypothetical protein
LKDPKNLEDKKIKGAKWFLPAGVGYQAREYFFKLASAGASPLGEAPAGSGATAAAAIAAAAAAVMATSPICPCWNVS